VETTKPEQRIQLAAVEDPGQLWVESIPDEFSAGDGHEIAQRAVTEAEKTIRDVAFNYHGTIPPPPWPAHPELVKALDDMRLARDFFAIVEERKPDTKFPKVSTTIKTGPTLVMKGKELYKQLEELKSRSYNAPTLAAMLKLVPDPRTMILGRFPLKETAIAGVALWFLVPEVRKFAKRTLRRVL
jgi:hypothetical protein